MRPRDMCSDQQRAFRDPQPQDLKLARAWTLTERFRALLGLPRPWRRPPLPRALVLKVSQLIRPHRPSLLSCLRDRLRSALLGRGRTS